MDMGKIAWNVGGGGAKDEEKSYCRTHNLRICLYIAYIACGSASLYIKTLYFLYISGGYCR